MFVSNFNNITSWIEEKSSSRYYLLFLTFFLGILLLILSTPQYLYLCPEIFSHNSWQAVIQKSQNLLDPLTNYSPESHAAKKVFRLTVPFIIKIFNLTPITTYIFQFLIGFLVIYICYKLSYSILNDSVSSTFLTASISFIYFGKACFVDLGSAFDGWAFLFILLAMFQKRFWLIFLFSFLAAWTDERAFLALPIVATYHSTNLFSGFKIFKIPKQSYAVIFSFFLYIVSRLFLTIFFDLQTPTSNSIIRTFKNNLPFINIGLWGIFEGLWLIIIISFFYMIQKKNYSLLLVILFEFLILMIIAFCVYDITRSLSYIVPTIFISVSYLQKIISINKMHIYMFIAMVFSFLYPSIYIIGGISVFQPIYLDFMYLILK